MKLLIIFSHPKEQSLNSAILRSVEKGAQEGQHEVRVRDLYALNFNPVLSQDELHHSDGKVAEDVKCEQEHILWADALVFIYPIWWYDRPAILKGWIDRVFTFGFAYGPSPQGIVGLLAQKKALVFQTAGSNEEKFTATGGLHAVDASMKEGTLKYCGIQDVEVHTYYSTFTKTSEEIAEILERVKISIANL